jgi:hypothetical protein
MVTVVIITVASCKKDGNPNKLPAVSPAEYEGKIDGFSSSDEIFPNNLIAYWSFENSNNEMKRGIAPTQTANASFVDGGVKGKALSLNSGFLYYATQFTQFKTDSLQSWSMSVWVKILNNQNTINKRTMLFQLARPGQFTGSINFHLNTQANPSTNTDVLRINPTFSTVGGGTQDNLNNNLSPKIGMDKWTHIVLTYDYATGVFDIWADGVKVGGFPNRGTGNNSFKAYEPNEVIIGANYNAIGKTTNAPNDVSIAPMTGQIDELRVYNRTLPDAFIKSLFNLGKANK